MCGINLPSIYSEERQEQSGRKSKKRRNCYQHRYETVPALNSVAVGCFKFRQSHRNDRSHALKHTGSIIETLANSHRLTQRPLKAFDYHLRDQGRIDMCLNAEAKV